MTERGSDIDAAMMRRAIQLAYGGRGYVEPNPMVGCIVVQNDRVLAEGFHRRFGEAHAEVDALRSLGVTQTLGSTIYVTLEPCVHHGKTPPCIDRVLAAKPARVVIGAIDPHPEVSGRGLARLRQAGIDVEQGIEGSACQRLIAPFTKLQTTGRPWVTAKWAMTLDGRMATRTGDSQWITSDAARNFAHQTRGRMDAIVVGIGTALRDKPRLTARPAGPRLAVRVVADSSARLPLNHPLVETARELSTLIACGPEAPTEKIAALTAAGCLIFQATSSEPDQRLNELLDEFGRRQWTNILIDGGPHLLGAFLDQRLVDEVEVYVGTKLVGGPPGLVPNMGHGLVLMSQAVTLDNIRTQQLGPDLLVQADLPKSPS
jgi:diaminohydroxyphosphoribosylaminopyrimidine deaminase/5-amino-6-(5-phosphoribosylamino)uracil reductase